MEFFAHIFVKIMYIFVHIFDDIMDRKNFKVEKILIITLSCAVLVLTIFVVRLSLHKTNAIENEITTNENNNKNEIVIEDELEPKDNNESKNTNYEIEENTQDEIKEELYSVIFLDSDGQTLQSSYYKKGTVPYYSGKELTKSGCKFNAWIPSITTVSGNQAYIATYSCEPLPNDSPIQSENQSSSSNVSYASIMYKDMTGTQQTLFLQSGTTINFSAGEHGSYDSIPPSITLTDNQQLDITDASYEPTDVEVNYIFKGFSYSGNTMKCEYSLVDNIVNVECKQIANSIIKNNVIYIQHDYIESTGTQYINTGVIFDDSNYNGEVVFQYITPTNNTWLFGAVNTSYVGCEAGITGANFYTAAGFSYSQTNLVSKTKGIFSTTSIIPSNNAFYLFARNAPLPSYVTAKIFSCLIKQGETVKVDLVPAERVSDGVAGMLDKEHGTFLLNSGSGVFKHPDVVLDSGINVGKIMATGSYEIGSTIELTAVANSGYIFAGWSDGVQTETRTISVGDDIGCVALFALNE